MILVEILYVMHTYLGYYIYSVVLQDFVSGLACWVNQYH
jgi:hypothetical protein